MRPASGLAQQSTSCVSHTWRGAVSSTCAWWRLVGSVCKAVDISVGPLSALAESRRTPDSRHHALVVDKDQIEQSAGRRSDLCGPGRRPWLSTAFLRHPPARRSAASCFAGVLSAVRRTPGSSPGESGRRHAGGRPVAAAHAADTGARTP